MPRGIQHKTMSMGFGFGDFKFRLVLVQFLA